MLLYLNGAQDRALAGQTDLFAYGTLVCTDTFREMTGYDANTSSCSRHNLVLK